MAYCRRWATEQWTSGGGQPVGAGAAGGREAVRGGRASGGQPSYAERLAGAGGWAGVGVEAAQRVWTSWFASLFGLREVS